MEHHRQEFYLKQLPQKLRIKKETLLRVEESRLWCAYYHREVMETEIKIFLSECNNNNQKLSAWYLLAEVLEKQGLHEEADALWEKVLMFSSDFAC